MKEIRPYQILDWDRFIKRAHPRLKQWFDAEAKYLRDNPLPGRVLEWGCGTGRVLEVLTTSAKQVIGIDHDRYMVKRARAANKHNHNVTVCLEEGLALLFPNGFFDGVVCFGNTFGNLGRDKLKALNEMKRVCRKGGRILISVYNEKALESRLASYILDELPHSRVTSQGTVYTSQGFTSEQFRKKRLVGILEKGGCVKPDYNIRSLTPISYLVNITNNT